MAHYKFAGREPIKVKLIDLQDSEGRPINSQIRTTIGSLIKTPANPGGYFLPGKYYDVVDMDKINGQHQILLINEYGVFVWVNMEYTRAWVQPGTVEPQVVSEGATTTYKWEVNGVPTTVEKGSPDESEEPQERPVPMPTRPGRPRKTYPV